MINLKKIFLKIAIIIGVISAFGANCLAEVTPTSLISNQIIFSTGVSILDNFDDIIPPTAKFPEESDYTSYVAWYEAQLAPTPGTMNVSAGADLISGLWQGAAFNGALPNVFLGVQGIPDTNGGDPPDSPNENAWSEVTLKKSKFKDIIYINSEGSKSYIRGYSDLSMVTPINPTVLGFNLEGGNVDIKVGQKTKLFVDSTNKRVGIGTSTPDTALHLKEVPGTPSRNILRFSGNFYGKVASMYELKNTNPMAVTTVENRALSASESKDGYYKGVSVNVTVDAFSQILSGNLTIPNNNTLVVFASMYGFMGDSQAGFIQAAATSSSNYRNPNDTEMALIINIKNSNNNSVARSSSSHFGFQNKDNNSPGGNFKLFTMYKNNTGSNQDIYISLEVKIYHDYTNVIMYVDKNNASISAFVLPTQ